ncbi:MAG TPA: DotA/TraY family protein, partial [Gammaproteobacteria bacterium]|nr:DotA/TraY family protein [Gammaproteobacteria bacterium]
YGSVTFQPPTFVPPDASAYPGSWFLQVESLSNAYIKMSDLTSTTAPGSSLIQRPNMISGEAKQLVDPAVKNLSALARAFIGHLSERDVDPIASFQKTGSEIMVTTEALFFTLVVIAVLAMSIACIASGAQPGCYIVGIIITLFMPVLMIMLGLLWTAGVSLGLYLPLVPYLVFTFTALGWLLICIEAMVAAPIVALGITTPGQDLLGRASPAVMLITNIFLRPSLMVMGFVAAARLAKPVINMINFGFEGVVLMQIGALLLFGNIALIVIYAGICVTAIHQVFSLIYILPDRVIRWIGGQAEQSMVERAMEETKKAAETATHATQQVMKGTTEGIVSAGKMAVEKGKAPAEGGGGGGGGQGGAQGVSGLQM